MQAMLSQARCTAQSTQIGCGAGTVKPCGLKAMGMLSGINPVGLTQQ